MVTINPRKRLEEIKHQQEDRHLLVPAENQYHTVDVLSWSQMVDEANYWSGHGWRIHTVRDGIRGSGIDVGYRLLLERKEVQ